MNRKTILMQGRQAALVACSLLIGAASLQSCKDDDNEVLTGQPEWLGESIYAQLQKEGNYTTLLKLIDEVDDNKDVLSTTGSKTLFAANDDAFKAWFADNNWQVTSYEQLSPVQKKVLLNNSMLDNAYLLELMSNVKATATEGKPVTGMAMRRPSSASIYDSVTVLRPEKMPTSPYWDRVRKAGKPIYIFKDNTTAPLIHFLPAFMQRNGITGEDLKYLTNGRGQSADEAWVNGAQIINADKPDRQGIDYDITCKNGYIHKVDRVIEASPNMADIIHQHENTSIWASIIDRFSAPYSSTAAQTMDNNETQLKKWQRLYGMNDNDTVYTWRYLSSQLDGSAAQKKLNAIPPDSTNESEAQLRFDPGWNQYIYTNTAEQDMYYDAGAMIVPTNEAVMEWWNGDGSDLQQEYHYLDSIPLGTIAPLVNVNMLPNFIEFVPTKFKNILDDAKQELGVTKENIVSSYMGCNGMVYVVNKVFPPALYASVAYPAWAHPSAMNIIKWAIDKLGFLPYLLAMDQTYSLILPENDAMLYYVDPVYYNDPQNAMVIQFSYDPEKSEDERVQAKRCRMTIAPDGTISAGAELTKVVDKSIVRNRLKDLVDQLIILGDITDGREYYKTKGGSYVRVTRDAASGTMSIQGGYQIENGYALNVNPNDTKAMVPKRNGYSVILKEGIPLTASKSVYNTLNEKPEVFGDFLALMQGGSSSSTTDQILIQTDGSGSDQRTAAGGSSNYNIRMFSNYNYTVYAPGNDAIQAAINEGYLPTWNDVDAILSDEQKTMWEEGAARQNMTYDEITDSARNYLSDIIRNFVRYHIQDNSLAIGSELQTVTHEYETMQRNVETDRFYGLTTTLTKTSLQVTDGWNKTCNVVTDGDNYNKICREYWFKNAGGLSGTVLDRQDGIIYFVSSAVVHQIDGVLWAKEPVKWNDHLKKLRQEL